MEEETKRTKIGFISENLGEIWYWVNMESYPAKPIKHPLIKC